MQALGHIGYCSGKSTSTFLVDNNENNAFIAIKWSFFDVLPLSLKVANKVEKKSHAYFLKTIKIEVESLYIIQR